MIRCPDCGTENKLATKFCPECGASLPAEASVDNERTVLLSPQTEGRAKRAPGTIEQAMRMSPEARKPGDRPPPTPPDDEMTVILPKKSARPPKYEPAPPTVTGPLTEPIPHGKSSRSNIGSGKSSVPPAARKPKTPIAMVLALLVIAGGSAGYLGWLILKKNKVAAPIEKVAVAPPVAESVQPAPAKAPAPSEPAPPTVSAAPSATPSSPTPPTPPEAIAAPSPATNAASKIDTAPVSLPAVQSAEPVNPDTSKTERAKAERLKKEQARLEAAKKERPKKPAAAPTATAESARHAGEPRPAFAPIAEPVKQEPTPLALLRDELRACDGQNIFTRESCKQQALQRRCAGMWDRVPECPYKKDVRLY